MDFWALPVKSEGLTGQVNAVFSWLWPIAIPFILFFVARMIAWGSLKGIDSTPEHRKRAARAYLYLDGAYGLYPQALLSIAIVLSSVGAAPSPIQTILRSTPENSASDNVFSTSCYVAGTTILAGALIWETILKRFILPRRLFAFNNYSKRLKWFWMLKDKGRNLGPWNKDVFSYAYAVPTITIALGLAVLVLSWLIGTALYFIKGTPTA